MVEATSPSQERGSLPQLVRHPSKESKAEETSKKGKIIKKLSTIVYISLILKQAYAKLIKVAPTGTTYV